MTILVGKMKEQIDEVPMFCEVCGKETGHDVWNDCGDEGELITNWRCGECGTEDADK